MSIQSSEKIQFLALELQKLTDLAKNIKFPKSELMKLVPKLSKFELMILDSSFKNLDLIKLRNTMLFLEDQYAEMLQNTTTCLFNALQSFI